MKICTERNMYVQVKGITDGKLKARPMNTVAVLGGGLMGSGIATACLTVGIKVILKEVNDKFLQVPPAAYAVPLVQTFPIRVCPISLHINEVSIACLLIVHCIFAHCAVGRNASCMSGGIKKLWKACSVADELLPPVSCDRRVLSASRAT